MFAKKAIFSLFVILMSISATKGQDTTLFEKGTHVHQGQALPYRILYPEDYDTTKTYPVVFFLHGAGERGDDNQKQLAHGSKLFLDKENRRKHPAIVVFPQCPSDSYWSNVEIITNESGKREFYFRTEGDPTAAMQTLVHLVGHILKTESIDLNRVYLGGLSMGGMGTYELLRRQPDLFAAAFAICGGDHPVNTRYYQHVPLWIFHGEKDDVVPPENSAILVNSLQELGADPKYKFYPDANHNSWDPAFAEPDLLSWLFSHTK